jgi:hypothetical protein
MIGKIEKLSKNKFVVSILSIIAVLNLLAYINDKSIFCIAIFLLCLAIINNYSENFSYGILFSLFITNIVFGGCKIKQEFI